jgi:hypothetical protein
MYRQPQSKLGFDRDCIPSIFGQIGTGELRSRFVGGVLLLCYGCARAGEWLAGGRARIGH